MTKNLGRKLTALLLVFVLAMSMVITASAEEESTESSKPELLSVTVVVGDGAQAGTVNVHVGDGAGNAVNPTNGVTVRSKDGTLSGSKDVTYTSSTIGAQYTVAVAASEASDLPTGETATAVINGNYMQFTSSYGDVVTLTKSGIYAYTKVGIETDASNVTVIFTYDTTEYAAKITETGAKYETVQAAIDAAEDGQTVVMLADAKELLTIENKTVTLDLAGYTLTKGAVSNPVVSIKSGATVTLTDSSEAGTGTVDGASTRYDIIYVYGGSTLIMEGGTVTNMNNATNGAVYVSGSTFIMNGGAITGNTSTNKGGVYAYNSTVTMNGGSITGNTAGQYAGGVYLRGSTLTVNGGLIANNSGTRCGDDIYGLESTVVLNAEPSGILESCGHAITGWYNDANRDRWSEESATRCELGTYEGTVTLKAAHGLIKVSEPGIAKSADVDTASAGDTVTYTLTSTVPETLPVDYAYSDNGAVGTCNEYVLTFHDAMPDGLDASTDSIVVKVGDTVIDGTYYTVSAGTDCTYEVAVDLAALYNDGVIGTADLGLSSVTVTYTATVGETTGALTNTAWVTWTGDGKSAEASATVTTYGVSIYKYDLADTSTGLAGAEFTLTDASGNVVATVTSGEDGTVSIVGLAAGTYYLTETSAPEGYVASEEAITISTDEATDYVVSVSVANAQVPTTGGAGTAMYTMGGIGILLAAAALFLVSRKSRRNAE